MDAIPIPQPLLYLLAIPVILFSIWHIPSALLPPPPPSPSHLQNKRIILLTAHPDDECMFFSPTLTSLSLPKYGNHIKILCLSSGNAEGKGETRKKELEVAGLKLGLRKDTDVLCIDAPELRDGMEEVWDEGVVSGLLKQLFAPGEVGPKGKGNGLGKKGGKERGSMRDSKDGPKASIDVIITFDGKGVSGHPNHKAVSGGAKRFVRELMDGYTAFACPVGLYTLTSVGIVRKYAGFLDMMPTYIVGILGDVADGFRGVKALKHRGMSRKATGNRAVFMSDMERYLKGRDAMVNGHKSQMVWFRWGWISVGRYMFVNDLKRENVGTS